MTLYAWKKTDTVKIKVHGKYHCAPPEICEITNGQMACTMTYSWHVRIKDHRRVLDDRGFLFEQVHITGLLESLPSTELSCERLTKAAHCYVIASVQEENPNLQVIWSEFSLSPTTSATVQHCCTNEDEIQDFVSTLAECRSLLFPNDPKPYNAFYKSIAAGISDTYDFGGTNA